MHFSERYSERGPYRWTDDTKAQGNEIALVIRSARKGKRLTQAEAAKASGMQRSLLAQIETGRKNITVPNWKKLSELLEIDHYEFKDRWSDNGRDRIVVSLKKPIAPRVKA